MTDDVIIEGHCLPDEIRKNPSYYERYRGAVDHIEEHGISVTEVALEDDGPTRTLVCEIFAGHMRDENNRPAAAEYPLSKRRFVTLATVDGRAFAGKTDAHITPGIKTGMRAASANDLRTMRVRGQSPIRYAEYGAEFTVDASEAVALLLDHGYRCVYPAERRRATEHPISRWILYEVGGPFEAEVKEKFGAKKGRK